MKFLFDAPDLTLAQVRTIAKAMHTVALVDDVHPTEMVLLRAFYESCQNEVGGLTDFNDILAQSFDSAEAREVLGTPELRRTAVRSCLLLAYADGAYSAKEQAAVAEIARDLEVGDEELVELSDQIQDHLLGQLSHVRNTDALQAVARELKGER